MEVSETQAIRVVRKVVEVVVVELHQMALMALVALEETVALLPFKVLRQETRLVDEVEREVMRLGTVE